MIVRSVGPRSQDAAHSSGESSEGLAVGQALSAFEVLSNPSFDTLD